MTKNNYFFVDFDKA